MAEDEAAAAADKPSGSSTSKTDTYPRDRLVAEGPAFFGKGSHVVSAALDSVKGSKKNFTRAEAEKAIKDYLDRPAEMSYVETEE